MKVSKTFYVGWVGNHKRKSKRYETARKIVSGMDGCKLKMATIGSYPHERMPQFYKGINCLLVISETEAHPLPVYEAMAMGVPVITTQVGDVCETLVSGQNSILLNNDFTIENARNAILILKNNPMFSSRISLNAIKTVRKYWSWETWTSLYDKLFQHVLDENNNIKKVGINVLFLIDIYGWAWNIVVDGAIKYLSRYYPSKYNFNILAKVDWKDENKRKKFIQIRDNSDIVFTHSYFPEMPKNKTIMKVGGYVMFTPVWKKRIVTEYKYVNTSCFPLLEEILINKRANNSNCQVSYLGEAVDLELFHR